MQSRCQATVPFVSGILLLICFSHLSLASGPLVVQQGVLQSDEKNKEPVVDKETQTEALEENTPEDSSDDEVEQVKKTVEELCQCIQENNYEAAFKLMTPQQVNAELAEIYLLVADLADDAEMMGAPELGKPMLGLLKDFGFEDAPIPDIEDLPDFLQFARKLGVDFQDRPDQKHEFVEKANELMKGMTFGLIVVEGEVIEVSIKGDAAMATLEPKPSSEVNGQDMKPSPILVKLERSGASWLYAGIDYSTLVFEEPSASKIEGLGNAGGMPIVDDDIEISGKTLDGKTVSLKDYRGKVVLVDFWGPWCGPCVAEIPKLKKIYAALKNKDFEVLSVAVSEKDQLEEYFADNGNLPWQNIFDVESAISDKLEISAFPTKIIFDAQGKHISSVVGSGETFKEIAKALSLSVEERQSISESLEDKAQEK